MTTREDTFLGIISKSIGNYTYKILKPSKLWTDFKWDSLFKEVDVVLS